LRPHKRRFNQELNPFEGIQVFLPKSIKGILQETSERMGLPMSKLTAIAIDNELDSPVPFAYNCLLPSSVFIPNAFAAEAARIVSYLMRFPSGTGRDQLMLCRRDMDIPNKETFMYAYRELLEVGIIEEVPPPPRVKFEYPVGYKYTRLAPHNKRKALK
jgi:hypothetical protein